MIEPRPAPANAAWVVIESPLAPQALARFCEDVERLYRINPCLEFREWRSLGAGRLRARFRNLSNQRDFDLELAVESAGAGVISVRYDSGIKRATRFEVAPSPSGSTLTITDEYAPDAGAESAGEVDRSLNAWGAALRNYLLRERRWGGWALWRWYMRRVWLPMKPAGRRITFILLAVTAAEVALIAIFLLVYWLEQRG